MPLEEAMPILKGEKCNNNNKKKKNHGCSVFHVRDIAKCSAFTSEGKIKGTTGRAQAPREVVNGQPISID